MSLQSSAIGLVFCADNLKIDKTNIANSIDLLIICERIDVKLQFTSFGE
jgi:hypothetical protein